MLRYNANKRYSFFFLDLEKNLRKHVVDLFPQQQRSRQNEFKRFRRRGDNVTLERSAFHYDQKIDYCADTSETIGDMTIISQYCKELKYSGESTGLCYAGRKVKFQQLVPPPDHYSH